MESDRFIYVLGKYSSLIFGIVCVISIVVELLIRIDTKDWDEDLLFVCFLFLVFCVVHYKLYATKFVMIKFGNQKIEIKDGKNVLVVSWLEVESISQSGFSLSGISGLYTLKVKGIDRDFIFGTGSSINIFRRHIDHSELASLIGKMKRELSI